jgi:hypothetical protein
MTKTIDQMPLFPDEATIALAVLGPKRAKDWPHIAKFLEDKHAFPRVDKLMGGRYWLAAASCVDAEFAAPSHHPAQTPSLS